MITQIWRRALFTALILVVAPAPAACHSEQDAIEVLRSIDPVPGVNILAPPKYQHHRARVASGEPFKVAVSHQPLTVHESGLDLVLQSGRHTTVLPGANTRSAAALLGVLHRNAASAFGTTGGNRAGAAKDRPQGYENITAAFGMQYSIPVTIDNATTLKLAIDTGTADLWAVAHGAQCLNSYSEAVNLSACQFGPTFPKNRTFSHGIIANQHLFVRYPDGEMASGPVGRSDIRVGGITVREQQIALVNRTRWLGNNLTSGVIGLGYPSLGHMYRGNENSSDWFNRVIYQPLFTSMVSQGVVEEPFFGIALARNSSGGVIAWGGMPDVSGLRYSSQTYVPVLITELNDDPLTAEAPSFYTIVPDGFNYGSSSDSARHPYIIDTGTALTYIPNRLAEAINKAFNPPAAYFWELGGFYTDCAATSPSFSVIIGKTVFVVNPVDMIFRDHPDPDSKLCMTAISAGGTGPYILGATFLNNVAVGFDVQAAELMFVSRHFY